MLLYTDEDFSYHGLPQIIPAIDMTINTDIFVILCPLLGSPGCLQGIARKMRGAVCLGEREGGRPAQTQPYYLILLVLFIPFLQWLSRASASTRPALKREEFDFL